MHPRYHAEKGMCDIIFTSRINQRVAYMQQFHFKSYSNTPHTIMKNLYDFKMTQPLGMGFPQSDKILSIRNKN